MATKTKWCIVSHRVGAPALLGGLILSSVGYPYRDLKAIAKQMNSNGEGERYTVREYPGIGLDAEGNGE